MSNKDKFYESYEISTYTPESDQCESVNRNVQYFIPYGNIKIQMQMWIIRKTAIDPFLFGDN